MSAEAVDLILKNAKAEGPFFAVLIALGHYADESWKAWPSISSLSKVARVSERTVHNAIASLSASREIEIDPCAGPSRCNIYILRVHGMHPAPRAPRRVHHVHPKGIRSSPSQKIPNSQSNSLDKNGRSADSTSRALAVVLSRIERGFNPDSGAPVFREGPDYFSLFFKPIQVRRVSLEFVTLAVPQAFIDEFGDIQAATRNLRDRIEEADSKFMRGRKLALEVL